MIKHIVSFAAMATFTLTTTAALAGEPIAFNQEASSKAKMEGKTVMVDFHATWCPVCKKQSEVIPQVLMDDKFKDVVVLTADYDTEKDLEKQLKISGQSTLVVFKGQKEVGRAHDITTADAIGKLLDKGL